MYTSSFNYPLIVSGLPRSGTSMMMSMLSAAGLSLLTDNVREPDANNPKGYYEYEPVKKLMYENNWLYDAKGKVVKIVSPLLPYIPLKQYYTIIFIQRNISEIISSQNKMMQRSNSYDDNVDDQLVQEYELHLNQIYAWINEQKNINVKYVNYNQLLKKSDSTIDDLASFLGLYSRVNAMYNVIDKRLYREQY